MPHVVLVEISQRSVPMVRRPRKTAVPLLRSIGLPQDDAALFVVSNIMKKAVRW